ncbi:annexin A6-like [Haemaphysalis longicornis]
MAAKCLANIPYYFAEKLDSALKAEGVESCDKALVRIIVSRCEVDLAQIKDVYAKTFNMTLQDAIRPATLRPYAAFNAQADANTLWTAMKGKGADKTAIMEVLCARSGDQRQEIVREYKQMFNRDLEPHIKSELRGRFEELVVTLLCPMEEFLARELRAAIKGAGADEEVLVEILCTRSNKDIRGIKESYAKG